MPPDQDLNTARTNGRWAHAAEPANETDKTLEQDQPLTVFLRQRIEGVGLHGCGAERKALAGVLDILNEFEAKHDRAAGMDPDDYFTAQIDTLRWVLQCVASATFSSHPEFLAAFRPSGTSADAATMEALA